MPEVVLEGVPVRFPFEPYEVQKAYMSKVIQCLQQGVNGILESPTGTGKTLCLLCSTLAWLEVKKAEHKARLHNVAGGDADFMSSLSSQLKAGSGAAWGEKSAPPKIIYSSRTHSQLSQAVNELKRTTYSYLKVAVLGSRDQMCIHPEVSKETNNNNKVHMCQLRVKAKTCYFNNQVEAKKDDPEVRQKALDIEDLVKVGRKKTFCPYYMARELKQDADIIFLPYNYLLDPKSRKAHGVELQGNIVIFDEAHNVEKMCEEAASLQIRSTDIALCIDEVTQVMKKMQEMSEGSNIAANDVSEVMPEDFNPDDLYTLKALFLELEKVPFPIQLENPHIIQRHQVWVGTICNGPDGFNLNSSFQNRSDPRYISSLGQTILNFSRIVPDGLLIFFPSYPIMRNCRDEWQNSGIWSRISATKPIFVEPQTKDEFHSAMTEYYQKINDPALKGACFMAVCRGKVSEGLDFANRNGRAVIITGLPYPPFKDPRVVLKQKYLEETRLKNKTGLTGQEWYKLEASRAVNQAIGRVIRHKDDYGAIILCDNRFAAPNFRPQLSAWVRPFMNSYSTFGPALRDIIQFFKNAQVLLPQPDEKNGKPSISAKYDEPPAAVSAAPPVHAHALQTAPARLVVSDATRQKMGQALAVKEDYNNMWSNMNYKKTDGANEKREGEGGDGSVFSALEKKTSVVDFNSLQSTSQVSCKYNTLQVGNKKRKIKIVSKGEKELADFLKGTGPSQAASQASQGVAAEATSCSPEMFSSPGNSQELISGAQKSTTKASSSGALGSGRVSSSAAVAALSSGKENGETKKLGSIADYIKDVKSQLNKEQYGLFSSAVKSYQKSKDYDTVVGTLASLFSQQAEHHRLFIKFEQFLSKDHRLAFRESCEEMLKR
ncbi:regulator of telomere elongation helicase 1 homolog [Penaeus chinensis]|uniref:regulator of telomere elongation helicase 1 homolog n=1 Tax=Penaeus chinensis TaxID=139456 RepID=UPI001FB5D194|nr:regulator of telomere elongation helicase 1 homolog [Penaeus chinensis]